MLPKKTILVLIAVAAAVIFLTAWIASLVVTAKKQGAAEPSEYSAVYLTTGDIYFGKFDRFPRPRLTNVWFLQRTVSGGEQQLGIAPLKTAFWDPLDEIYLNSDQIVFWTRLRADSDVVKALQDQSLFAPQPQSAVPPAGAFTGPPGLPAGQ